VPPDASAPGARRVALVAHRLAAPAPTGIGRYYTEIVRGLAEVADPATTYVAASTRERTPPRWVPPSVEVRSLGGPRKLRATAWAVVGRPAVDRALGRPDLVHVLHPWAPVPSRAPLVATVQDLFPMLHREWHGPLESWAFRRGVQHVAEHAALVIVPSAHTGAIVTERLGIAADRLRVVWNGVGDEFRRRAGADEQTVVCARHGVEPGRYLVTVGTVSERKNLPVVLRALTLVDPAALGATALLVAGPPGRGAAAIERAVDDLGLRGRVHFAGFVPDGDLPVLVGASAGLVHPSLEEGFGITPLEAMAAGVPAVASAVGSVPEITGASAVLVAPDDVDGWAAAITAIATDPDRRAALVAAGDEHQARFTWRRAAEDTAAVHAEVLAT
jgi:glycosyltransferase involved in cell wall biosynthesis